VSLARFSVRNPVAVNLLMVAILALGLFSLGSLVREFFPNIEAEQISITVPYPGATPEEIERSVTRLVEREIENVDGVKEIRSRVFEGVTLIVAELEEGADRGRILNDIRGEVDKVKPELPDGAEDPEIEENRPYIPAIAVVVSGDVTEDHLQRVVEDIREDLLDIPVVTELVSTGVRAREFHIEVRPERLEAFGITFGQVGQALAALNLDLPGGQLEGERTNIRVRTVGEKRAATELEAKVVLTGPSGRAIRLGEIARVRPAFEDKVERGRFQMLRETPEDVVDGASLRRATQINVFKAPEQDAIAIATAVREYVATNPTRLGGAITLHTTTDLSRIIEQRIELLSSNAQVGLLLVLLVLAVFLELRIAFWVAVGLGVSFAGTFAIMAVTGQSINLISLFGLIVVLGLIVDDAIVIGENIFAKHREGLPPGMAAELGVREVAWPVVAAVLTTCAAFAPLAFLEGRLGDFLGVLPPVVVCALGMSLVEAFLILPSHLSHAPGAIKENPGWFARAGNAIKRTRQKLFEGVLPNLLERALRFLIPYRYAAIAGSIAILMGAFGLVAGGIVPFVLLQDTDAETITAKLEMAAGTPESETVATLERIEDIIGSQPEVQSLFTVIGASFGERGRETASDPATVGQVTMELFPSEVRQAPGKDLRNSLELVAYLRKATADLPAVRRLSFTSQGGGPQGADVEIRVRADEMETLAAGIDHVREKLENYVGVFEIYDDLELGKLEARLELEEHARLQGLTTRDVAIQVRHALFGFEVQDLQIGNEEVTVRAFLPPDARSELADLGALRIALQNGGRMPLEEAVSFTMDRGYAALSRVDGKRAATIRAEVNEEVANVSDVNNALVKELATISEDVPGVTISFEGARKQTRESVGSLQYLFPIALLLIFCIIAIIFRSYIQPILVMTSIPFAMGGAIAGHALLGYPFTILSMIGGVALAGIVVNDGLILVDLANRLRRGGMPLTEAVVQAARGRMRAILLTSITTCVGLAPLMLEKSFQAQFLIPMAVAIVFGLAFATFIILLLLPLFYLILEDLRGSARWLWGKPFSRHLPFDPGQVDDEGEALPAAVRVEAGTKREA